jgi:hypothetical protein
MPEELFAAMPSNPAQHFKLYFYAGVLHLLGHVARSFKSWDEALDQFPFLEGYFQEISIYGLDRLEPDAATKEWHAALQSKEAAEFAHLPIRALKEATGLDYQALTLLMCIGLIEEDARFGTLFEALQVSPGQHRPTLGLLNECWAQQNGEVRTSLRQLQELGLVEVINPEAPRIEWAYQVQGMLWDALRGEKNERPAPWARYHAPEKLAQGDELILSETIKESLATIPALLASGDADALIVRGPQHNGRRTLVGAIARSLGRGLLEVSGLNGSKDDAARWRALGILATMYEALPLIVLDPAPGETIEVSRLNGYLGALGIVLGRQGGLSGSGVERALTLTLEMPDALARRRLWSRNLGALDAADAEQIAGRFRLTSGNIGRVARLAETCSTLAGREAVTLADVREASRSLNHQALDTLAAHVNACGDWANLAVKGETMQELANLESRCRHRERLGATVGASLGGQLNCGVRALFSGPSGTGKTLAARMLASVLKMDLYRLDLSAIVNKYIGETEKSLNRILARAEELDVILLLDEGDALLTRRTDVQSSNDRYANLETNFLLQRLETFEGIIVITTNASERIDNAFQRRMDVVVNFQPPDAFERALIWQLHLPQEHAIGRSALDEIARRCALSGGQIRNAVLHAALLALDDGGVITSGQLETAVQREYRKEGAVCPLRPLAVC